MAIQKQVLLGVCDELIPPSASTHWQLNKIGGYMDTMPNVLQPSPRCSLCNAALYLIVQVYCPLEGSVFHRTLYVFACVNKPCWNKAASWSVLRTQCRDTHSDEEVSVSVADEMGKTSSECSQITPSDDSKKHADSWCDDADDWGDDNSEVTASNTAEDNIEISPQSKVEGISDQIEAMTVSEAEVADADMAVEAGDDAASVEGDEKTDECTPEDINIGEVADSMLLQFVTDISSSESASLDAVSDEEVKALCPFYINVFEEEMRTDEPMQTKHEKHLLAEYVRKEGKDFYQMIERDERGAERGRGKSKAGGGEGYEKSSVRHGDATFHKFYKMIASCPKQIIRYESDGTALDLQRMVKPSLVCQHCGAATQFELQLMPALVNFLKLDPQSDSPAVEFGTVQIYTCSNSCWHENQQQHDVRHEHAVIQVDPDHSFFSGEGRGEGKGAAQGKAGPS